MNKGMVGFAVISSIFIFFGLIFGFMFFIGNANAPITATANDFTVVWFQNEDATVGTSEYNQTFKTFDDLTIHKWIFSIQNLNSLTVRNFNISILLNSTSFPLEKLSDVKISEWKNFTHNVTIETSSWVLSNKSWGNLDNFNISHLIADYQNGTQIFIDKSGLFSWDLVENKTTVNETHYATKSIEQSFPDWKRTKMNLIDKPGKKEANYGNILIPKFGSKAKDDTENGVKWFMIEFTTPLSANSWGSSGYLTLRDETSGLEYDPWWDASWTRRQNVTLTELAGVSTNNFQVRINITYDSDMQADFDDLRVVEDLTEQNYWIENKSNSGWATIWANISTIPASGTKTFSIYYGNSLASAGNTTDALVYFTNFPAYNWRDGRGAPNVTCGSASFPDTSSCYLHLDNNEGAYYQLNLSTPLSNWTTLTLAQQPTAGGSDLRFCFTDMGWDASPSETGHCGRNEATPTNQIEELNSGTRTVPGQETSTLVRKGLKVFEFWKVGKNVNFTSNMTNEFPYSILTGGAVNFGNVYNLTELMNAGSNTLMGIDWHAIMRKNNVSISLGTEEVGNVAPVIGQLTEPTDPSTYSFGASYNFSANFTDTDGRATLDQGIFEHNMTLTGSATNVTNSSLTCKVANTTTNQCFYNVVDAPAFTIIGYRWIVNDTSDSVAVTSMQTFTINNATPSLSISGSNITYPTSLSVTGSETNSGDGGCTYTLHHNRTTGYISIGSGSSVSDSVQRASGTRTYYYNTTGCSNYTSSEASRIIDVAVNTTGIARSFSLNDSYTNFNETVRLSINSDPTGEMTVEVQSSAGKINRTATWNATSGNHTLDLGQLLLGNISSNATQINITNLYFGGANYTNSSNVTTLNFNYAIVTIENVSDTPDPATNSSGSTFTVYADFKDSTGVELTGGSPVVQFNGANSTMAYANGIWSATISSAVREDIYQYTIYYVNSSYQSQTSTGVVTVLVPGSGGSGSTGGGGGGSPPPSITVISKEGMELAPGEIQVGGKSGEKITISGFGGRVFRLKNTNPTPVSVTVSFTGNSSEWANLESVRYMDNTVKTFDNYKLTPESITVVTDSFADFTVIANVPEGTQDGSYTFLVHFTDLSGNLLITGSVGIQLSRLFDLVRGLFGIGQWFGDLFSWGIPINGDSVMASKISSVPYSGLMIFIGSTIGSFFLLTRVVFVGKHLRMGGASVQISFAIALSLIIAITFVAILKKIFGG